MSAPTVIDALRALWPLSENYEYADELGGALRSHYPALQAPALPLSQAANLAVLARLERHAPRDSLEALLAGLIATGRPYWLPELHASFASLTRDWTEPEAGPPPSLAGEPVRLYAPEAVLSVEEEGYGDVRRWTDEALADASLTLPTSRLASREELERAHSPRYLRGLEEASRSDGLRLTPETYVWPRSFEAVRVASGALVSAALDDSDDSDDKLRLCLARPGSHHASRSRAGGTCLVNGLAVAAWAALDAGAAAVAVLDLDAHHGNGTQEIFWQEPRVLTASVHQKNPFFPGTGEPDERGAGSGFDSNLNLPVAPGGDWLQAAVRAVEWIEPERVELILVELSGDAHRADPASDLTATDDDYRAVGRLLAGLRVPVVCELGSGMSERAFTGALRGFVQGFAEGS